MTKTLPKIGLYAVLPIVMLALASTFIIGEISAQRAADSETQCRAGQVLVFHYNRNQFICTSESGAAMWVRTGQAEMAGTPVQTDEEPTEEAPAPMPSPREETAEVMTGAADERRQSDVERIQAKLEAGEPLTTSEVRRVQQALEKERIAADAAFREAHAAKHGATGTMQSMQDPGIGHEGHQLAIILNPSEKVYEGTISYDASEPVQLVALHGPLAQGEDAGQPIWTPDGETKFALTLVDPETSMGTWEFTGNALAVHTMNPEPFAVSYSTSYTENEPSETTMSGTATSMQDPGIGHEGHQLAIILPPREALYEGTITYSASEPVQLVALHGPLLEGEEAGQAIWTPDGETKFALTLVDDATNMGTWDFVGNALAVHTMNEEPFTVSYSVKAD